MNADGQTLGRFASKAAKLLRGKHKADFTPHVDCGDNVIVINSEKIKMTGRKWTEKEYVNLSESERQLLVLLYDHIQLYLQ